MYFGSEIVPGEDFEVQNPDLTSKIGKSGAQRPKSRKNRSGTLKIFVEILVVNPLFKALTCVPPLYLGRFFADLGEVLGKVLGSFGEVFGKKKS